MTESHINFLGIPVEGEPDHSTEYRVPQRPLTELQPTLESLLSHPEFDGLRWRQYTPYFNDGDPCVFGIHGVGVRLNGLDDDEAGDYEDGFIDLPNTWDDRDSVVNVVGKWAHATWDRDTHTRNDDAHWEVPPKNERLVHDATKAVEMIESGAFNDVLLKTFGDHAVVTMRRDKIELETYEHD